MQEKEGLVPPQDLPLPSGEHLQLRQERRCVRRPREPRPASRTTVTCHTIAVHRTSHETLLDLIGRPRRAAVLQLALNGAIRQLEEAHGRIARDVQEVVGHVVPLLVRQALRGEVLRRRESTGARVQRAPVREEQDLVEGMVQLRTAMQVEKRWVSTMRPTVACACVWGMED